MKKHAGKESNTFHEMQENIRQCLASCFMESHKIDKEMTQAIKSFVMGEDLKLKAKIDGRWVHTLMNTL